MDPTAAGADRPSRACIELSAKIWHLRTDVTRSNTMHLRVTRCVRIIRACGNKPFLMHSYRLVKPLAELFRVADGRQTPHGMSCIVGRQDDRAGAE